MEFDNHESNIDGTFAFGDAVNVNQLAEESKN